MFIACTTGSEASCMSEDTNIASKRPDFFTTVSPGDRDTGEFLAGTWIFHTMIGLLLSKNRDKLNLKKRNSKIIKRKRKKFKKQKKYKRNIYMHV